MTKQSEAARRRASNLRQRKNRAALRLVVNRDEIAASLPDRMLTMREVLVMLGLNSPNTVRSLIADKRFPPPVDLGLRVVRWWYSDVVAALKKMRRDDGKPTPPHRPRAA